MSAPPATAAPSARTEPGARLRSQWGYTLAQATWVAVVAPTIVLFVAGLLVGAGQLGRACAGPPCPPPRLTPDQAALHQQLGLSLGFYAWYFTLAFAVFGSVYFAVALFIFWRRSRDWTALLVSFFLVMLGAGAMPVIHALAPIQPQLGRAGSLMLPLAIGLVPAVFGLFPDSRFVPRWMVWLALAWLVRTAVETVTSPPSGAGVLSGPPGLLTVVVLAASIGAQVYRYRRVSTTIQRQQTKWAVLGFSVFLAYLFAIILTSVLVPALAGPGPLTVVVQLYVLPVMALTQLLILPATLAVALLRYRLWDVDFVINRALVYSGLTTVIVGLYVLVVGALGALFQASGSLLAAILATGLAALLFQPLRLRLQRAVNRAMYGERDDPYAVLSRLGRQLEDALAPEAVLPAVAAAVREALRLPYVAVYLLHGPEAFELAAESVSSAVRSENGKWRVPGMQSHGMCVPLVYQGETVGYIVLGPHAPDEAFTAAERKLLVDLARQAGAAAHTMRLTADLQRSRERLVTAREEERRRLRRDLHDGLGSQLAALHLRADTANALIAKDPAAAQAVVVELRDEIRAAVGDIRRLVYDLRPPALDELGLAGALRALAAQYRSANGLQVTIDAPEALPALPAAAEVAAYRVAQEALTNVARHARARHCQVTLVVDSALRLEIRDDGIGFPLSYQAGVGLRSMRERAAELGGTVAVANAPNGGAQVRVRLPLALAGD